MAGLGPATYDFAAFGMGKSWVTSPILTRVLARTGDRTGELGGSPPYLSAYKIASGHDDVRSHRCVNLIADWYDIPVGVQ